MVRQLVQRVDRQDSTKGGVSGMQAQDQDKLNERLDCLIWTFACSGMEISEEQARAAIERAQAQPLPEF